MSDLKNQDDKAKFKKEFFKRLIILSVKTLKFSEELRKNKNLWSVADQLVRSTTSIGANVVEAKSASSKKDYIKFFEISPKSANETKFWLIVIKEYSKELSDQSKLLLNEVDQVSKIIGSSILTLKGKR